MSAKIATILLLLALPLLASAADTQWLLEQSTLTYHVSHPLHQTDGVSHAARGKGICHDGQCDFLIAVPVKSFDSGDSNRDIHMVQVTRGAQFPMVTVRTRLPESDAASSTIHADLEIQFAGQTATYKQVPLQLTMQGNEAHVSGTIPTTLSDFKIDPPSLLTLPVKNDIPIRLETVWKQQRVSAKHLIRRNPESPLLSWRAEVEASSGRERSGSPQAKSRAQRGISGFAFRSFQPLPSLSFRPEGGICSLAVSTADFSSPRSSE